MAKIYIATKDDVTTLGGNIGPIVQSELDEVYAAVAAKGGTVPTEKTIGNLKAAVESVPPPMLGEWLSDLSTFTTLASDATSIRSYAFYNSVNLQSVNLPNAISLGVSSFNGTKGLKIFSAPNVSTTGASVFAGSGIEVVKLPSLTVLQASMFQQATSLRAVILDSVTSVTGGGSANSAIFAQCSRLEYVKAPSIQKVTGTVFWGFSKNFIVDHRPTDSASVLLSVSNTAWMNNDLKAYARYYCSDGYLTWDGSAWVLNAYTGNEPYYNGWED